MKTLATIMAIKFAPQIILIKESVQTFIRDWHSIYECSGNIDQSIKMYIKKL